MMSLTTLHIYDVITHTHKILNEVKLNRLQLAATLAIVFLAAPQWSSNVSQRTFYVTVCDANSNFLFTGCFLLDSTADVS